MADIRMRNVYKSFKEVRVIERVDLDIEEGEFAVFVGPLRISLMPAIHFTG
ncbi:MAG: hypothetical protein H6973_13290 [Gammaproteobacteria bacterium]|nr:hypothetical protein [Gammaproteobacteria bacterium]